MLLSLLCNVLFMYFACNDNSLFKLLTNFAFCQLKKLNKDYIFLPTCFTFLNSVRLTPFCPNTQKPFAGPLANTKVYKFTLIGEAWNSMKKPILIQIWTVNCCDRIVCPILNDNWLVYVFKSCCVVVKFFYNFFTGKIILDLFQNNVPLESLRLNEFVNGLNKI